MKQVFLILLAVSCTALAQIGINIVKNSGFEYIDAKGNPSYWDSHPSAVPTVFTTVTDTKFEGERSCRYSNHQAGFYEFLAQIIPALPGKTYEFSIYVKQVDLPEKGKKATPNLFMEFAAHGRYLSGMYLTETIPLNNDWFKLVGKATVPINATLATIGFRASPDGTNAAMLWFDNCSVMEIEEEKLNDFALTNCYRDQAAGGKVTISQGATAGVIAKLKAKEASMKMEVIDTDGNTFLAIAPDTLQRDFVTFVFDSDKLSAGQYTLRGTYTNSVNGKTFTSRGTFTKLTQIPKYRTYIDEHHRLIVDGKPFFPLGMYFRNVTLENLQPYLSTKFNCLMPYIQPDDPAMYDYLQKNNLKLLYTLQGYISTRSNNKEATNKLQKEGLARLDKWKHHPAILAWYINDELVEKYLNDAIQFYHACAKHDPSRPAMTVLCIPREMRAFSQATDIIGNDPYPIPESLPLKAYDWTQQAKEASMGAKMLIQVPQVMCWGRYWYNRHIKSPEESAACRRPTYQEMNAMSWMCIAGGANGLLYYSYFDLLERAQATDALPAIPFEEHFGECKQIADSIMAHEQVLLSIEKPLKYTVADNDGGEVVFRTYGLDGVTWLLAVNTSDTASKSFQLNMERPITLVGLSLSEPKVNINGNAVSATLAPLESVFIQLK